jgi:hypothetical protein
MELTQEQRAAFTLARNQDLHAVALLLLDWVGHEHASAAARLLLSHAEANIVCEALIAYGDVPVCTYESTGDAYDAVQVGDAPLGAVLLVESERVAGVADVWPFAVTAEHGAMHATLPGFSDRQHVLNCSGRFTVLSIHKARSVARLHGLTLAGETA